MSASTVVHTQYRKPNLNALRIRVLGSHPLSHITLISQIVPVDFKSEWVIYLTTKRQFSISPPLPPGLEKNAQIISIRGYHDARTVAGART